MSAGPLIIENMFDQPRERELLSAMKSAQRDERTATARRLLAAGRLCQLRMAAVDTDERMQWCIDNWEAVAAEVGAELGISRGRASTQMNYGLELLERLPALGAAFAAGDVEFRVVAAAVFRTGLITDAAGLAEVDRKLAAQAAKWNALSQNKVAQLIDWIVVAADPAAVRVARSASAERHVEFGRLHDGTVEFWGVARAPDAAALDQRLDQLAASVCRNDSRTKRQRRADALAALAAGGSTMMCDCGSPECPAAVGAQPGQVVIHVLAESGTVSGESAAPGYLPGYGAVPAETIRELAASARLRPLVACDSLKCERRYRPSAALADFIRCRDLTCRFPGCDARAEFCDIDHTIPFGLGGPTHPSNLALLCRAHHLVKTFWSGESGWREKQFSDGTIVWTSPAGRFYTTKPGGTLFFPQLGEPTGVLNIPDSQRGSAPGRTLAMPLRRRTRAADRRARIAWERGLNEARIAADPPPF